MPMGLSWGPWGGQGSLRVPRAGQECSHHSGDAQSAVNSSPRCHLPRCPPARWGSLCRVPCRGADGGSLPWVLMVWVLWLCLGLVCSSCLRTQQ